MPEFKDLPDDFRCPYRDGCPYLEGLSTGWVFERYQEVAGTECQYEYQLEELYKELQAERRQHKAAELENQQLRAQLAALHRRQFKGRRAAPAQPTQCAWTQRKKRGAPAGHLPWRRPKPQHLDQTVLVPAPVVCPHCRCRHLQPVQELHQHVQEDIVLEPRVVAIGFLHQQSYCPTCGGNVLQAGPGELLGSYIGPATKATAIYLRYELNVPDRKISRFFAEFFGLKFVPASAYGFERQAVRRAWPLYEDLRQKIRALPVAHGDETSWRHNGCNHNVWYAGNPQLAFYQLSPDRSSHSAVSIFGERFSGILVSDAYAAYHAIHAKDWQSCLFHIKNKAKELDQELALLKGPAADPQARQFCQRVQEFIHATCQVHHRLAKGPWRARAARRQEQRLRRKLQRLCRRSLTHPRTESFRQRLLGKEQKHLFTCFRHPQVPPTNSQAEQSMRPVVLMRHVVHCTRSDKGLENHSVLRSLFETARRQGKKVHQFFYDLFTLETAQAQAALYRQPPPAASPVRKKPAAKKPP